jgi:hypothetical protein
MFKDSMTLKKIAKRITPQVTYYAYARIDRERTSYYWKHPVTECLLPITPKALKSWLSVIN